MRKLDKRGMTLVEVIVSLTILAVAALIFMSSVSAAFILVRRGVDTENAGSEAFAAVEKQDGSSALAGTVRFSAGGHAYTVTGEFISDEEGEDPSVRFVLFQPTWDRAESEVEE